MGLDRSAGDQYCRMDLFVELICQFFDGLRLLLLRAILVCPRYCGRENCYRPFVCVSLYSCVNSVGREEREERRTGEGQPYTAGAWAWGEFLFEEFIVLFQSVFGLGECEG